MSSENRLGSQKLNVHPDKDAAIESRLVEIHRLMEQLEDRVLFDAVNYPDLVYRAAARVRNAELDLRSGDVAGAELSYLATLEGEPMSELTMRSRVGLAEVKEVFRSPKLVDIAGSIVLEGFVKRSNPIRVLRDNVVIYEGELESLRRFKDDVNEVRSGTECGIGVKNYNDVKVGDQIGCRSSVYS